MLGNDQSQPTAATDSPTISTARDPVLTSEAPQSLAGSSVVPDTNVLDASRGDTLDDGFETLLADWQDDNASFFQSVIASQDGTNDVSHERYYR